MEDKNDNVTSLFERLNRLRYEDRSYYEFKRICERIDEVIRERHAQLIAGGQQSNLITIAAALTHTIGKEVESIKYYQDKMHKKNAAKIRKKEYEEAVEKAYRQVHLDIINVLIAEQSEDK